MVKHVVRNPDMDVNFPGCIVRAMRRPTSVVPMAAARAKEAAAILGLSYDQFGERYRKYASARTELSSRS